MPINAAWHDANPMPKNPTIVQRVAWHEAHQKECACRPIPAKLAQRIAAGEGRPTPKVVPPGPHTRR